MTDDESSRKRLGDFEILRELGRGGMGIVYEARQVSLNRKVALKVISGSLGLSSQAVLRFQREAEAAGKLHHTNIVPIYSTGEDGGAHFYAMELIDGPSLHQVIRSLSRGDGSKPAVSDSAATMAVGAAAPQEDVLIDSGGSFGTPAWVAEILGAPPAAESTPAPGALGGPGASSSRSSSGYFDTVATMIAGVADGLDHAHEHGVIHRDIKPANLLLSRDGRVSINDFGLARMLEQPGMTLSGEFVGSPLYMSPEQITAGRAPLDHRTDIYSLGATLYELLTLRPVFPGRSRDEVIAQILHKEPELPRRQSSRIPVDLETICLKALEKDPDRRYQTAGQLAEDLRRFVDRHAISARRIGPLERSVRWARKNRALTAMACLTLAVAVCATFYIFLLNRETRGNTAKDAALLAAMGGDIDTAILEIDAARELGVDAIWQLMIHGLVNLYQGQPEEALARFETAVEQNPASVMARSMLVEAYLANGQWNEYVEAVDRVDELANGREDLSAEDLLFRGWSLRVFAGEKARRMIRYAIEERPTFTLARMWEAEVAVSIALTTDNIPTVLEALQTLQALEVLGAHLADNPRFRSLRLWARLAAVRLYRRAGRSEEARRHLSDARPDVEYLGRTPRFYFGNNVRLQYFKFRWEQDRLEADLDSMAKVMRVAAGQGHGGWLVDPYWTTFYRRGGERVEEASRQLESVSANEVFVAWARIVLLMDLGRRQEAETIRHAFLAGHPVNSGNHYDVMPVFFLPGPLEAKIEYARGRAAQVVYSKYWTGPRDVLEYMGGVIGEDELVVRAGDSLRDQAVAYFAIGLRQLAEGRRREARKSFGICAASPVHYWSDVYWAQAFVERMERDATWPDWLPAEPVSAGTAETAR